MEAFRKDAPLFNDIGLKWKIWLENKEEGIIGAIMIFKDQESYEKYPDPELVRKGLAPSMIEVVSSQVFDIIEDLSEVNNAPI